MRWAEKTLIKERFSYGDKCEDKFKIVVLQMTLSYIRNAFPSEVTFYRNVSNNHMEEYLQCLPLPCKNLSDLSFA